MRPFGRALQYSLDNARIGLGIIALPTNETIINIHSIGSWQVLTLIGIGLGIGSLKEFISRS